MKNEKQKPASQYQCAAGKTRQSEDHHMSFSNCIRNLMKNQYFRRLVVRAIEDFIVLFMLFAAIWSLAFVVSGALKILGVA